MTFDLFAAKMPVPEISRKHPSFRSKLVTLGVIKLPSVLLPTAFLCSYQRSALTAPSYLPSFAFCIDLTYPCR